MGARRLPASRRHGTHDGIASSCTDARAACACPLPRARPVSLSRPKCWQHGVVRHVEPSWDQGARAESARDGHSRPRMGTAVARARGGPPASPGSEASRGSICVSREKIQKSLFREHVELSSNGGYIRGQTVDGYKTLPNNLICFIRTIKSFNVGRRLSVHCSER